MEYRCISADCHMDLCWLPHDLFTSSATQAMKSRMPYVKEGPDGFMWEMSPGVTLSRANAKGGVGTAGNTAYVPGTDHRFDRIATTGLYSEGSKGIFRPSTPELRLKEQDRDGLQAEVIYGLLNAGNRIKDDEVATEFFRIYNDWLSAFCSYDRKRFVGLASLPVHSVEAAAAEARRVSKLNIGGLDMPVSYRMIPLWSTYWDPLWKVAAETNLAIHIHTISPPPPAYPVPDQPSAAFKGAARATAIAVFQVHLASVLAAIIHGGALERFPNLRVVLGESGIGWIPYVLDRMDHEYETRFKTMLSELRMKPSEYWRRQCRATFQADRIGTKLLDDLGIETVMWGSDFPHLDGVYPDSQEYIKDQFGHLPASEVRKIICENAGRFYGLIS